LTGKRLKDRLGGGAGYTVRPALRSRVSVPNVLPQPIAARECAQRAADPDRRRRVLPILKPDIRGVSMII